MIIPIKNLNISPSLIINNKSSKLDFMPEVKLSINVSEVQFLYSIKNISTNTAYEVCLFFFEDHYSESTIKSANKTIDILAPDETQNIIDSKSPFIGCMSHKEYWVEYNDKKHNHFRYILGFDNSGKIKSEVGAIENKTNQFHKKVFKKNIFFLFISDLINRVRYFFRYR